MTQESTSALYWEICRRLPAGEAIIMLRRRRDDLLNRACSRSECVEIMAEVRRINRRLDDLSSGVPPRR